jgi:hypothetical protein
MFEKMRILDFVVGRELHLLPNKEEEDSDDEQHPLSLSLSFWGAGCLTGYAVENVVPVRLDRLTLA